MSATRVASVGQDRLVDLTTTDRPDASRHHSLLPFVRFGLDAAAVVLAHFLAWMIRFVWAVDRTEALMLDESAYVLASWISVIVFLSLLAAQRLYDEDTLFPGGGEFVRLRNVAAQTAILFPALAYFTKTPFISRIWVVLALGLAFLLIAAERMAVRLILSDQRRRGRFRRRVIVVRAPGANIEAWQHQRAAEFDAWFECDAVQAQRLMEAWARKDLAFAGRRPPQGIVITDGAADDESLWRLLIAAGEASCPAYLESPITSVAQDRLAVRSFGGRMFMKVGPPALTGFQAFRKRVFDVIVSGTAILVLSPLLLLTVLAVLMTSGRPIFYGQTRVGHNGKPFKIWKFRSMRPDAEAGSGAVWAKADDDRRTPIGAFLRKTSIDELPQLWNIVKGDMSIVGPRPERPNFVQEFEQSIAWYPHRHRMRPGLTGWAQANGLRGNTSLEDRVTYDNYYIEHWSLTLDIKIMLLTVREVFRGEHAY